MVALMRNLMSLVLTIVVAAGPRSAQAQPVLAPPAQPVPVAPPADLPAVDPPVANPPAPVIEAVPVDGPTTSSKTKAPHKKKHKAKRPRPGKVQISGFITALYKFRIEQNDDGVRDPDAFRLGKAVVRASGRVTKQVGYTVEVDPRSPTILGVLRDGYVSLFVVPGHEIRIGQQKTPFGYEAGESTMNLYTVTRSELSEGLGRGVTHRDIGIGLVGKRKLTDQLRLEDAIALVNGAGIGVQADDTQLKNLWARVGIRYRDGDLTVHGGVSGAIGDQMSEFDPGPPPVPAERFGFRRVGADVEVDHRLFFASAEFATGWDEVPAGSGDREQSIAYLAMIAGKTKWHAGPVARYDAADTDGYQRITVGGYWGDPGAAVRALAHYEWYQDDVGTHDGRVTAAVLVRF
jgi:hypothetical protein